MDLPFNFIRPKEEIPQRIISNKTFQDITNDSIHSNQLLSSPISSNNMTASNENPSDILVTHLRSYPLRTRHLKNRVETLMDETHDLRIGYADTRHDLANTCHDLANTRRDLTNTRHELAELENKFHHERNTNRLERDALRLERDVIRQEREAEKGKIRDWETRTRVAQGLNDKWVLLVKTDYNLLRNEGINYLPHILSVWAVKHDFEPAPSFSGKIDPDEVMHMNRRADLFEDKGLGTAVSRIWQCLDPTDRSTMVAMYLGTRNHPRTSIAHPSPTGDEARRVIKGDSGLSVEEKVVAYEVIETAVDKVGNRLFSHFSLPVATLYSDS